MPVEGHQPHSGASTVVLQLAQEVRVAQSGQEVPE